MAHLRGHIYLDAAEIEKVINEDRDMLESFMQVSRQQKRHSAMRVTTNFILPPMCLEFDTNYHVWGYKVCKRWYLCMETWERQCPDVAVRNNAIREAWETMKQIREQFIAKEEVSEMWLHMNVVLYALQHARDRAVSGSQPPSTHLHKITIHQFPVPLHVLDAQILRIIKALPAFYWMGAEMYGQVPESAYFRLTRSPIEIGDNN